MALIDIRNIEMKRVFEKDIDDFINVITEVANWLVEHGMELWKPERLTKENFLKNNDIEELHVCYIDGNPAGTIILQETDRIFWPDAVDGESLFIHKLSVRRCYAKCGISGYMIDWAKEEAMKRKKEIPAVGYSCRTA